MAEALIPAPMGPSKYEMVECGGDIRWMDGKLQQRFVVKEYSGGFQSGVRQEWRDVPMLSSTPSHSNGVRTPE